MRTKTKLISGLLIALLFLTACAQLPQPSDPAAETTRAPGPALFEADYALLWEILESDYPYLPYLREKGVDIEGLREKHLQQAVEAANAKEFAGVVAKLFASLKNTGHLSLLGPEMFSDMYGYCVLSPGSEAGEGLREMLIKAAESGYYTAPETYSEDLSAYGSFPEISVSYDEESETLIFKIPTFYTTTIERDSSLYAETIAQYPEAKNIVFDVTGNSGGDTRYWQTNIIARFGEDCTFKWRSFYRSSPNNDVIAGEYAEIHSVSDADSVPEWVIASGLDRYLCFEEHIEGRDAIRSDAKRWVLADAGVFSAAEQFVCFCKATGWATVVGKKTRGDGLGFEPALHLLPDSGLLFRFSMSAGENPDGTMNVEGTAPDIVLDYASISCLLRLIRDEQGD